MVGTNRKILLLAAASAISITLFQEPAFAQEAQPADANAQPAASPDSNEILVTAQKRNESVQDVPIAISAISGASLAQQGITDVSGMMRIVPALHMESAYGEAQPRFNLRGIGNTEFSPSATPAVGVYVDEVYLNNTLGQGFQMFDTERVEVLRGPQGTLWGKNTTAGVVHAISVKPSQEFSGYVRAEVGDYNRRILEGAVGGGLTDTLAVRASFQLNSYDGYYYNRLTDSQTGGSSSYNFRLQALWTPTTDFDLLLKYARSHTRQTVQYSHLGLYADGLDSRGYEDPPNAFTVDSNPVPRGKMVTDNLTATAHWRFGDGYEVTNIASYIATDSINYTDDDAAPYVYEYSDVEGHPRQFSNELRISSPTDRPLSWIVGGYFLHETLNGGTNAFDPDYKPLYGVLSV